MAKDKSPFSRIEGKEDRQGKRWSWPVHGKGMVTPWVGLLVRKKK